MACARRRGHTRLSLSGSLVTRHQGHQLTPHIHQLLRRREAHLRVWVAPASACENTVMCIRRVSWRVRHTPSGICASSPTSGCSANSRDASDGAPEGHSRARVCGAHQAEVLLLEDVHTLDEGLKPAPKVRLHLLLRVTLQGVCLTRRECATCRRAARRGHTRHSSGARTLVASRK
jgi:hypothetical protein